MFARYRGYDLSLTKCVAKLTLALGLFFFCLSASAVSLPSFTGLVKKASPAVVNISSTHHVASRRVDGIPDLDQGQLGEWFRRFFGGQDRSSEPNKGAGPRDGPADPGRHSGKDGAPPSPDNGQPGGPRFETKSLGSGFIISHNGYILTNYHVVKGADEIIVKLSDRRQFAANVVGTDELSDIALLKIDASHLPVANIGSGKTLKVGQWVLAIGSPYGFDHSVTAGIVSARGRSLNDAQYVPFIQTDVAINPGNSGGPLFNTDGEVVGVNSQIYSRTGGYMGLSFAIPIDVAMGVADELKKNGHVIRGWLGVVIQNMDLGLAKSFGVKRPEGALVARVMAHSAAAKAGLKIGDVILKFNGHLIENSGDLPPFVGRSKPGDKIRLKVVRNGRVQMVHATIGRLPQSPTKPTPKQDSSSGGSRLGLAVSNPSKDERKQSGIKQGGVVVKQVTGRPAGDAGIKAGDVIKRVGGKRISDRKQFRQVVAALDNGKTIAVLLQRRGQPLFVAVDVANKASQ